MKLETMFRRMIDVGRRADWRGDAAFGRQLAARKAEYDSLSGSSRRFFDMERLWNPFGCSRIASGDPESDIRGMIVGINCTLSSILYAERLREHGRGIDAYLSHHGISPAGTIYDDINNVHYDILVDHGVPEQTAREAVGNAISGYYDRMGGEPFGFEQHTDMALLNVHNGMDNLMALGMMQLFDQHQPRTLAGVVEAMLTLEEFAASARAGVPPRIVVGSAEAEPGRIYFDALGGICLNDQELSAMLAAGQVNTVVRLTYGGCVRICREAGINLIFFPHNASDNFGINLMLDQVLAEEQIDIIPTDGFYRVARPPMTNLCWPGRDR